MKIKCAAIQMVSTPDVRTNLNQTEHLIQQAVAANAQLIALPENFAIMGLTEFDKLDHKEADNDGPIQAFLSGIASRYGIWIVAGTIPMESSHPEKVRAASLVYNDQGQRVARYDKIHLFDVQVPGSDEAYKESDTIEAGDKPLVLSTPYGKLGVAVCYDLRFPELFRRMAVEGMDILIVSAAFTERTGAAHWDLLVRTRAVENQCYVLAPNQGGEHANGRLTYGHSMIVDPWGNVLAEMETGSGMTSAEIDNAQLERVRTSFPALQHRKFTSESFNI